MEKLSFTLRILIIVYTRLLILGNFQAKNTIIFQYFPFQSEKLVSNVCSLWGKYHFLHSRRVLGSYLCLKYYQFGSFFPPYTIIRAYTIIRVLRVVYLKWKHLLCSLTKFRHLSYYLRILHYHFQILLRYVEKWTLPCCYDE